MMCCMLYRRDCEGVINAGGQGDRLCLNVGRFKRRDVRLGWFVDRDRRAAMAWEKDWFANLVDGSGSD